MLLEATQHQDSCFVTLTYNQETMPDGASLEPTHFKNWLKRFRKALAPQKIRFYGVGEYGDKTERPHYHAALFGVSSLLAGGIQGTDGVVKDTWTKDGKPLGYTFVGELNRESAGYIGGYVTKKMAHPETKCTNKCNHPKLNGRYQEFQRMSLKPGIGAEAMKDVALGS